MAALSNDRAYLINKGDKARKPTTAETASGNHDHADNIYNKDHTDNTYNEDHTDNVVGDSDSSFLIEDNEKSTSSVATTFLRSTMDLDAHAMMVHFAKGAKAVHSSTSMQHRCSRESAYECGSPMQIADRFAFLFQVNQSGVDATMDEHITQVLYLVSASPRMGALLRGTEFEKDAKGILKAIFNGEWAITGWLASSAGLASMKACVTKFLKTNETATDSSHVLMATCRLLELIAYIYGPVTYTPWLMQWQVELPRMVNLSFVNPEALKEMANSHVSAWFSPTTTNDLKSELERKGTLANFIMVRQKVTTLMVTELQTNSLMKMQAEFLVKQYAAPHPQQQTQNIKPPFGGGKEKGGKGKGGNKKPMAALKGYCLQWLQRDTMPCQHPNCRPGGKAKHAPLKHRVEFDAEPAQVRAEVVKEAAKLSPNVVVKVQA